MFLDPLQCFVQQQGKAHLPTLNMFLFYKVHLVQSSNPCFHPTSMLCSAARESPLAHSEHPFFKRVPLVKCPYPCFLTPLQCFVQQQGKAHLPTLNMFLFYKVHLVQSSNPCFHPTSMPCSAARESPLAHSEHAPLLQSPPCTIAQSMLLDSGQCFV